MRATLVFYITLFLLSLYSLYLVGHMRETTEALGHMRETTEAVVISDLARVPENYTLSLAVETSDLAGVHAKFVREFVDLLNAERVARGLGPLVYINGTFALHRVEYMAVTRYFNHYDVEGRSPIYYYTKLGGVYAIAEVIAKHTYRWKESVISLREMVKFFPSGRDVLDTFKNSPPHWRALMDSCATHVDVAVSEVLHEDKKGFEVYVAVGVETRRVEWVVPPRFENGVFRAAGYVKLEPVYGVFPFHIYRYPLGPRSPYDPLGDHYATVSATGVGWTRHGDPSDPDLPKLLQYDVKKTDRGWYIDVAFKLTPQPGWHYLITAQGKHPETDKLCDFLTYAFVG